MGILTKLAEGIFKVRIVPKTSPSETTAFTDTKDSAANRITDAIDSGKRIDLSDLLNITSLKGDRNTKYEIFEELELLLKCMLMILCNIIQKVKLYG